MPIIAAIGGPLVAATLGVGALGAGASIYAANKQASAAKNALALQQSQYNTAQGYLAPYRETGQNALGSINALYGYGGGDAQQNLLAQIQNSPDYQFALQQGTLGLDRSAAARGQLLGGGHQKDLMAFGQGLASQQFGNYFNRLMQIAGIGSSAAGAGANTASQFGQTGGNTMQQIGAAQASGPVGAANALGTLPQNLLYGQLANQMNNRSTSSYGDWSGNTTMGSGG